MTAQVDNATGTPIDKTMQSTHRDFGPLKDGVQERYLSYYGIRRAIRDGATLEVHYIRDPVPFTVDEKPLSIGFEQMCAEMELEDEEAKDLNAFFASCEQQEAPVLRGKPIIVLQTLTESACAIAASYPAKRLGITTGTLLREARRICPDVIRCRPIIGSIPIITIGF